jgi:type IV pilus assembly protein PilA
MLSVRKGFTLIELLIVVVIIGILATISVPRFTRSKEKVYLTTMKSDLRTLMTAQETYYADNQSYTTELTASQFKPSPGVTITSIEVGEGTFTAVAAYPGGTKRTCTITVGAGPNDGEPICN